MKPTSNSIDPVTDTRFELVRLLGEGATGAVYLALDRETGEQVALKKLFKLDQKSVLRFKREFRSVADVHHPNLVKLYDLQRGQEAWFITMEYVAGKDFREKLGAEATRSAAAMQPANDNAPIELLTMFYDLACGVHAIHRARAGMTESGIADPEANMRAYVPELMDRGECGVRSRLSAR